MNNEIITLGENKNEFIINQEFLNAVIEIEKKTKELKKAQEEYKSRLLKEMEEKGIFKISNEEKGISISYIESKNNEEVFHKNEFREKYPDIYDEFITLDGKKKAYLTIRVNND